ncbi:MAG: hypothetical protein PVJ72_04150 [Gammaproteobacteria bacterium]|jgi:hypothetical protein
MKNSAFHMARELFPQRTMQSLLWLISAILIAWLPITAHAVKDGKFDHFSTGFPLSGQHLKVDCESCHIRGVFKGTPKFCAGCHNGRTAMGKSSKHIVTTEACDDCHTTFGWERVVMDHSAVKTDCRSCHAQPRGHVPTTKPCDDCHMTIAWVPARFTHDGITSGCRVCHARELPNDHPPTSGSDCGVCHRTQTWKGAIFDHSTISAPCSTCHINDKPIDHIPTTDECGVCHTTLGWEGAREP